MQLQGLRGIVGESGIVESHCSSSWMCCRTC